VVQAIFKFTAQCHRQGGQAFEKLTAARERNNALFAFLVDPHSAYRPFYEWARFIQPMLAQEEKLLAEKKQKQQQQQQP